MQHPSACYTTRPVQPCGIPPSPPLPNTYPLKRSYPFWYAPFCGTAHYWSNFFIALCGIFSLWNNLVFFCYSCDLPRSSHPLNLVMGMMDNLNNEVIWATLDTFKAPTKETSIRSVMRMRVDKRGWGVKGLECERHVGKIIHLRYRRWIGVKKKWQKWGRWMFVGQGIIIAGRGIGGDGGLDRHFWGWGGWWGDSINITNIGTIRTLTGNHFGSFGVWRRGCGCSKGVNCEPWIV